MTRATAEQLQAFAEFDRPCPFVVTQRGELEPAPAGIHSPEVYHVDGAQSPHDVDIMGAGWVPLTGYTGQHGYRGAVMHASEYLGGGLARDILESPGVYVVVAVGCLPEITYPHEWSPSGARCVRCGLIGTGDPRDGSCERHPEYDPELVADDPDPEPAGWAVLRLEHVDYPHTPGQFHGCALCDALCYCLEGDTECVYSGEHVPAARCVACNVNPGRPGMSVCRDCDPI